MAQILIGANTRARARARTRFHRNRCQGVSPQFLLVPSFTAIFVSPQQVVSLQAFVFGILPSFSRLRDLLEKFASPFLLAAFGAICIADWLCQVLEI